MLNPRDLVTLILIAVSTFGSIGTSYGRSSPAVEDCNVSLDLTAVGLKSLPGGFVKNKFITQLTLDQNEIPSVSSEAFSFAPSLTYLSLAKNKLTNLDLRPFSELDNLETLILNENCKMRTVTKTKIQLYSSGVWEYEYGYRVYRTTPAPTYEEVIYCDFKFDSNLPSLGKLFVERNDIKNLLFPLVQLPVLTHLYLSHNPLKFDEDTMLGLNIVAPSLTHLYLRNCSIDGLDVLRLPTVTSLYLDDNEIHFICNKYCETSSLILNDAVSLETLSVSNNQISMINGDSFTHTPNLQSLDLSRNKITEIREGTFEALYELRFLNLGSNKILQLDAAETFADLTNLETLTLGGNDLSYLSSGIFANLTSLKQLMLNNTKISSIDSDIFTELRSLEVLDLAGNELSEIPQGCLPTPGSIITLNLDNNKFTSTEDISLANQPNMLSMSLRANRLTSISVKWILNIAAENLTIYLN